MERGLSLNITILEGASFLKLFAGEDEALLFRRDAFLVLDLGLDFVDRIICIDVKSDVLAGEGSNKDFHATTSEAKDEVERGFILDIIVLERKAIIKLLAGEDETLRILGDAFLGLDRGLDRVDRVAWLYH